MKTKLLIALWLCYVLPARASEESKTMNDTIVIIPDTNIKIIFIGNGIKDMVSFERIDTLKDMLIGDVQKAQAQPGYPKAPKTTHYFINENGKRRIKAESEDFLEQGIDVEKEVISLNNSLPSYAFIVHDLVSGNELQFYLADPDQLSSLSKYKLSNAFKTIANDKAIQRKNFRIDLTRNDNEWMVTKTQKNRQDMIEISPTFGFGLIGNQWSPAVGADLLLGFTNRYGNSNFRVGLSFLGYSYPLSNNFDFSNINFVQSYDAMFMFNLRDSNSKGEKSRWFGVTGGKLQTSEEGDLDNRWKFGIITSNICPFNFRFENIFLKDKKSVYSFTMLIPF